MQPTCPMSTSPESTPQLDAPRRRLTRLQKLAVWLAVLGPVSAIALALVLRHEPEFYSATRGLVAAGADPAVVEGMRQRASARFVSKVTALVADTTRGGAWSTAIGDDEINAWLAVELPANHPEVLPRGVGDIRVQFVPGEVFLGCRVGGIVAALAWTETRLQLLEGNRIAITVERCGIGLLPLPTGLVSSQLARLLRQADVTSEMLRMDGKTQVVVHVPATEGAGHGGGGTRWWLDGLRLEQGDIFLTGTSRRGETAPGIRR